MSDAASSPTVQAAVQAVRESIRTGTLSAGAFLPSETTLATDLGVSRGTIRRAIDLLVAAGDLTRRPHARPTISPIREAIRTSTATDVHVWVSRTIGDEPSLRFLRGVSRALAGSRYRVTVREPSRFVDGVVQAEETKFLCDVLDDPNAVGAIVQREPFGASCEGARQLVAAGKPLVYVDTPPPAGVAADHVGTANAAAARRCVEHLLERGHKHILCLTDGDAPGPLHDRIKGYHRAMAQAGLEARSLVASDLAPVESSSLALGGRFARSLVHSARFADLGSRLAHEVLRIEPRPTALFTTFDVLAYWVGAYLEGSGVEIPGEMSLVGFDWLARWESPLIDDLTTASQDFEGFGWHAAELLLDRVSGEGPSTPRAVLLDAPLVVRSSTTPELVLPTTPSARDLSGDAALSTL